MEDKKRRQAEMTRAYHKALTRLRDLHREEFRFLLAEVYQDLGMSVRHRRTVDEIRQDEIRKARELLNNVSTSPV